MDVSVSRSSPPPSSSLSGSPAPKRAKPQLSDVSRDNQPVIAEKNHIESTSTGLLPVKISFPELDIFSNPPISSRREFLNELDTLFPNASAKVGAGGDLFITPVNQKQKSELLSLDEIDKFKITCSLSKLESEPKRALNGIPLSESLEDLLKELKNIGVTAAERRSVMKDGELIQTDSVILSFNRQPPSHVSIAAQLYPLVTLRWRPLQCNKCWTLGHTGRLCRKGERCKICSISHDTTAPCTYPPRCINCHSPKHPSDYRSCPAYIAKQKILDTAQKLGVNFQTAKSIVESHPLRSFGYTPNHPPSNSPPPLPPLCLTPPNSNCLGPNLSTANSDVVSALKRQVDNLQADVALLKTQIQPLIPLQQVVESVVESTKKNTDNIASLENLIRPIIPVFHDLSPDLPIIKQICRLIATENASRPSTPGLPTDPCSLTSPPDQPPDDFME